jgi:hypothetical protein
VPPPRLEEQREQLRVAKAAMAAGVERKTLYKYLLPPRH